MQKHHRPVRSALLALAALTISLTGCGAPNAVPASVPTPQQPIASPAPSNMGALPTEAPTAPLASSAPDFGNSAIVAGQPGTLKGESEAPANASPQAANYVLNHASVVSNQIIVQVNPRAAYHLARYTASKGARVTQSLNMGAQFQVITLPPGMTPA